MTKLHRISLVRAAALSSAAFVAGACATSSTVANPTSAPRSLASNPLFVESTLPYHAPRFDLIRNEHYQPALEEGMRQQLAEIDVIAKQVRPGLKTGIRPGAERSPWLSFINLRKDLADVILDFFRLLLAQNPAPSTLKNNAIHLHLVLLAPGAKHGEFLRLHDKIHRLMSARALAHPARSSGLAELF